MERYEELLAMLKDQEEQDRKQAEEERAEDELWRRQYE